ncbi:hydroxymethylglutaryl-CoA reductase, degradative [Membranicola marinus]|uniref:3-hydroxy-3-methylglutaryl coenzyme A reductase n=1 Tax=Membranihabitans marinus TaxID=1227546 RepID=A0A953HWC5_9BACT|nr:hydroxymethylglutaryl-CoA reductase, degradative [Membranihabitans marinus]MBY5959705.1 hydroxymethylglutaryl-CoA reductase, degradative [Membranihabitans marinus]
MKKRVNGFSKRSKDGKLQWVAEEGFDDPESFVQELKSYWLNDAKKQHIYDRISENTISNFILPYGVAPNFIINGESYIIPMVIEESSVVAAASNAAKFWMQRGGFEARVLRSEKVGQIHFYWDGVLRDLMKARDQIFKALCHHSRELSENMVRRGGGILGMDIRTFEEDPSYFQFLIRFETCDSMGANYINSILEHFSSQLDAVFTDIFGPQCTLPEVLMSILSNYTPDCIVQAKVTCPVKDLDQKGIRGNDFADQFQKAVNIARMDTYRATTHNKGIYNGIDAVVLATGNDFRAIEAAGHAYAARDGKYRGLSTCTVEDGQFTLELTVPISVGTVGGLTHVHPLARRSLELLGNPGAHELMKIIAVAGLAQNFAAVRSLITTGIQKGHMKMHLINILNHLNATSSEIDQTIAHFDDKVITFAQVRNYLKQIRREE